MGTLNCANIITNNMDVNGTLEVDALSGLNQGFQLGSFQNNNRPTGVPAGTIIWNDEEGEVQVYNGTEWLNIAKRTVTGLAVTAGLKLWYDGDSWSNSENRWLDKSGNNNHSSNTVGTVTRATWTGGNGGNNTSWDYIYGNTNAGVRLGYWPGVNNDYTFIHFTRYTGSSRSRIWQGTSGNWLSGHWSSRRGVFYHEGWLNSGSQGSLDDWIQCTDTRGLVRINRGASQWTGGGNYSPSGVAINNAGSGGCCNNSERSNWATAFVAVYDRTLSSSEYQQIENYVYNTYQA
tara:strand:+ start:1067 stop:1936 length:870 start_codon:yes stop_codon:yes gene_type:complete